MTLAPKIINVELSPLPIRANEPVSVIVTWEGEPREGESYQWRRGTRPLIGQVGQTFVPPDLWGDLNCVVRVNNGYGTAVSISDFATTAPPPVLGRLAFTSGFSSGFK